MSKKTSSISQFQLKLRRWQPPIIQPVPSGLRSKHSGEPPSSELQRPMKMSRNKSEIYGHRRSIKRNLKNFCRKLLGKKDETRYLSRMITESHVKELILRLSEENLTRQDCLMFVYVHAIRPEEFTNSQVAECSQDNEEELKNCSRCKSKL
jgi:hypothetical protein